MTQVNHEPSTPVLYSMRDVEGVNISVNNPFSSAFKEMRPLDYSILSAMNMCPRLGIITYKLNKRMSDSDSSMALSAGSACHRSFAATRLIQLRKQSNCTDELFDSTGRRIFKEVWPQMLDILDLPDGDSELNFVIHALHTSDFQDSPYDKKRTMTNLEEAIVAYYRRTMAGHPTGDVNEIYVFKDGTRAGIEIPFDNIYQFSMIDGSVVIVRYCGMIDGIHVHKDGSVRPHENKTASRCDDSWRTGIAMSHQTVGYSIAAGLETELGEEVSHICIHGLQIPIPRDVISGLAYVPITHKERSVKDFFSWMLHSAQMYENYNEFDAPMHTHSCNRYFSTCSLVPYCDSDDEDKAELLSEMPEVVWNPITRENSRDE